MPRPRSLHQAFALTIASEIPLPEVPAGTGAPDVEVTIAPVEVPRPDSLSDWKILAAPNDVRGWIPSGGAFRVQGGREIFIDPAPDADERALRMAIVGPLLGVILTQRARFVLHASTVAIGDVAVAFSGPSGRGKSTLTAAMTRAGHALIADDMTVIDSSGAVPLVHPGFPRVKLWPDSASALDHDVDELPLLHPERTKRSVQLTDFHRETIPLARCYLLEDGEAESSETMPPMDAILALIGYTYQAQWLHETGASGPNLQHCASLVKSGVVRRLKRRRSFDALPDVVRFIEEDARR
jgi:hypothetical protein